MNITCLVDDCVAVEGYWGEHGLSLLAEAAGGRVLFDVGASGTVLRHNAAKAGADLTGLDAVVLSHGHTDHTGGLTVLAGGLSGVPVHAHPDAFVPRFTGAARHSAGLDGEWRRRLERATNLLVSTEPQEVVPGVWTSGEIVERPYPEGRGRNHAVLQGEEYVPDPYRDDLSLVLSVNKGWVVLLGCAHAGVLNILETVRQRFGGPIKAVIGGLHLLQASQETVREVAARLPQYGAPALYLSHCTGGDAVFLLRYLLPEAVHPMGVGTRIEFPDAAFA